MKIIPFFTLSIIALFCQSNSLAQSVTWSGRLFDALTRQPIPFATIHLSSKSNMLTNQIFTADSIGRFPITNLPEGIYQLQITAVGYLNRSIEINTGKAIDSIFLAPDNRLLEGVTVTSERPIFQRKGDKLVMPVSGNQLFKTSASALDIFRKIPGISVGGDGTILVEGRNSPGIFIDGKPIPMSAEEIQNYLSTLNPEMIASIELITNPPARYDGEFKAIIDIKLKRDLNLGLKGNITGTVQRNQYTYAEQNLLLTYKTKKIAYTLRGNYATGKKIYRYRARQHLSDKTILSTRTYTPNSNNNFNYQFGADYSISKNHQVELQVRQFMVDREQRSRNTLFATDPTETQIVLNTHTVNAATPKQNNYGANLNYSGVLGKTALQFLATWLDIRNRQQEDIQSRQTAGSQLISHWTTLLKNNITIRTAQADLSQEAFDGRISWGGKFAFTTTKNDLRYDTLNSSGYFVLDAGRSNNFTYDEYISAAYLQYERTQNNLTYSASIRGEQTNSTANSITNRQITKRSYLNLLPSLSITYTKDQQQYHFSFTRRITRPTFTQLNPFRFYLSPLNYHVGNPLLQPSKTSSFNIGYSYKTFSARISGGKETDPLNRYPEYNDTTHVLEYLGRNLPYNHFGNAELSYAFSPTKWWKLNHTLNIFYKKELTPYHDKTFAIGIWEYMINGSQVFSLPRSFNFDLTYKYQSKGGNGLYRYKSYFFIDMGLQKTWINGRLNTRINYYDIFNDFEVYYIFREKQIINNELAHWFGTSRVAVSISYSFGKSTYKSKQGRRVEEEGRTGLQQ
ncbi:TonB-dependent receptor family protein [Terrimonas sp. NA20]|uniref:TonB-dependent receptor family protein n=1 Tax=Terrimonas ginsenosidimutans TaxID=2908004 RepID=A0ABS9KPP9_9BACT|nr:TonB-dependent receptor family protein [Terrimonas ginsenosidimutans]